MAGVFPHADPARNTDDARFVPGGGDGAPPGSFVTRSAVADGHLTVVATFVSSTSDGWVAVTADRLAVYDAGRSVPLPSASIMLTVTFERSGAARSAALTRSIVVQAPPGGLSRLQPLPLETDAS